jgi:hypothetical protein
MWFLVADVRYFTASNVVAFDPTTPFTSHRIRQRGGRDYLGWMADDVDRLLFGAVLFHRRNPIDARH